MWSRLARCWDAPIVQDSEQGDAAALSRRAEPFFALGAVAQAVVL